MIKHRLIIIIIIGALVAISIPRLLIALENFESAARPNTDVSQYSPLFMLQTKYTSSINGRYSFY
jgi:hypothetical protein